MRLPPLCACLHIGLLFFSCLVLSPGFAETISSTATTQAPDDASKIRSGERLSDWLLRQPQDRFVPALSWNVAAQQRPQARLKQALLADLAVAPDLHVDAAARQRLAKWLRSLPVTGRVALPIVDARWLQAHPAEDPILDADQSITLPARPDSVMIITAAATSCAVPHRAGAQVLAYLRACEGDAADRIDRAWIIQPDGHVKRFDIAIWNRASQDELAPGAWVWAPDRDSGWPEPFSVRLTEFLATQQLATEPVALPVVQAPTQPAAGAHARGTAVSASDWGEIGLLQTPTARMADAGEVRFNLSDVYPYRRGNIFFQPLDWLEAGFRYTAIANQPYRPGSSQSFKDKSIDVKVRLLKESAMLPALSLGIIDVGGTGLFGSEYFVANKRTGDFDWSLGLGWGYLGGRGDLRNPLGIFAKSFKTRTPPDFGLGGTFGFRDWFHGPIALFGGVQYRVPGGKWLVKAELDGNNYRREPFGYQPKQAIPINVGVVYRLADSVDLSAGVERGNKLMLSFTFHGRLDKVSMPKLFDPPMPPVTVVPPLTAPDWSVTAKDIETQTLWTVREISIRGSELRVVFDKNGGSYWRGRIERAIAVLNRDAPANINRFALSHVERGVPLTEEIIFREEWVAGHTRYRAPVERSQAVFTRPPRGVRHGETALWRGAPKRFAAGITPSYSQTIGGPDGFWFYQLGIAAPVEFKINDSTWLSGRANLRLIDNYDRFKVEGPSNLPHVRTYLREYLKTSRVTMPNLQLTHVGRVSENQTYSVYGGYLESMFAGVGAEWLYRPWQSHVAFGVDVNRVQQRAFKQDFSLRDYRVTTGHATLYWDTGWNSVNVKTSAGQYLAGDRGVTVDVSRTFTNGLKLGAFATKTNVSAAQFGEGSFNKGVYVSIPFDAMLPRSSLETTSFLWTPLTRDGGAPLARAFTLFDLTSPRDKRLLSYAAIAPESWRDLDDNPMPEPRRSLFGDFGKTVKNLGSQASSITGETLLLGGGIVAVAALLDRPVDRWTRNHQSSKWNALGKAATGIPLLLAAGTGLLWTGLGDDMAAETAWTSVKAAALTLATGTLTKFAVGRARPYTNSGTFQFSGFNKDAVNSSFPSDHMGIAFALVTPFAEQYGANWLYAVAGATAFGRVQQRQHFVSDTVAGGLIGYGIGSLLLDQQRAARTRVVVGPDRSLRAYWQFD